MQNIKGNVINDVMLSVVLYPLVAVQLHDEALAAQNERPAPAPAVPAAAAQPPHSPSLSARQPQQEEHVMFPPVASYPGYIVDPDRR